MYYKLKTYEAPELQKIWRGYIETETYIVWFPADGGKPVVFKK